MSDPNLSSFIWSVADLLRGDYKQSEYGKVILPFTVLRRLDCVLEPTKSAVLAENEKRKQANINPEPFLLKKSGQLFFNTSPLDMKKLMGDQDHLRQNLDSYIQAFSPAVRDIFEAFEFHTQIEQLAKAGLLYLVAEKFAHIDLHPEAVSNAQIGTVFEELIRKFAEISNETAGKHFTPREVIGLMVNLLFIEDDEALTKPGVVGSVYVLTTGAGCGPCRGRTPRNLRMMCNWGNGRYPRSRIRGKGVIAAGCAKPWPAKPGKLSLLFQSSGRVSAGNTTDR